MDVLLVTVDKKERALAAVKDIDLRLPLFWDEKWEVARAYNASVFPRAYLIDRSGRLGWIQEPGRRTSPTDLAAVIRKEMSAVWDGVKVRVGLLRCPAPQ